MTYISSQHYINDAIVAEKIQELQGADHIEVPCCYVGEIDGVEYAIQLDAHHTLAAARELGLEISFVVNDDPEGLTGQELLDAHWIDGDWYDVETSNPYYYEINLIWQGGYDND